MPKKFKAKLKRKPAKQQRKAKKSSVVHPVRKPDVFDMLAHAAHDEIHERLATPAELATLQPDEWEPYKRVPGGGPHSGAAFQVGSTLTYGTVKGPSVSADLPRGYISGPATDKYLQRVLGFPRLPRLRRLHVLVWEQWHAFLERSYIFASRLGLTFVVSCLEAFYLGLRRAFERIVQKGGLSRLEEAISLDLGEGDPKRHTVAAGLLAQVLSRDQVAFGEMVELQRLPISLFAVQVRLAALDEAAAYHWPSVTATLDRADVRVREMMSLLEDVGAALSGDAHHTTSLWLVKALYSDAEFCSYLAGRPAISTKEFSHRLDAAIDKHLPEIILRGIEKSGQPIPEAERASVGSELFGSKPVS